MWKVLDGAALNVLDTRGHGVLEIDGVRPLLCVVPVICSLSALRHRENVERKFRLGTKVLDIIAVR